MNFKRTLISFSMAAVFGTLSGTAAASGFALIEQSASGMGNAFAGGAASAEDASTIFFNPAGMTLILDRQLVLAVHAIKPSANFSDTGSTAASAQALGGNGGDAGSLALVPNAYFAMEVNPKTHIGLGINAPFGLQTEYDSNWMGRFQAIKSKIETVNLNPSVSYDVNDSISIGAGLNYQRITGELSSAANYAGGVYGAVYAGTVGAVGDSAAAALAGSAATAVTVAGEGEGLSTVSGNDAAWGYNLGLLFRVSPQTRVGLAYRSTVKYTLSGTVAFSANRPSAAILTPALSGLGGSAAATAAAVEAGIAAKTANGAVTLPISMPDSFSLSGFHQMNDKWDVMADVTWTGWSVLQQLKVDYANGSPLLTVDEKWKDTWRISAGTSYRYNEQWKARAGIAFDQSPVSDSHRTARIPDNDRTWLTVGGQYKLSKESAVDFGYAHLFVKDSTISDVQNLPLQGKANGNLIGTYKNSVDILSAQYAHSF